MADISSTPTASLNFWNFSLTYYKHSNSSEILLRLQNEYGLDVNLILFALWVGRIQGAFLLAEHFQTLEDSIASWRHNIIQPLRKIRQTAKLHTTLFPNISHGFLGMTADIELESERICQALLTQEYLNLKNLPKCSNRKNLAAGNLDTYFSLLAVPNHSFITKTKCKLVDFMDELGLPSP